MGTGECPPISACTEGVLAEVERFGGSFPPMLVTRWVPRFLAPGAHAPGSGFRVDFEGRRDSRAPVS
eukprot:838721-Pyramimonas_sp.AAC.1